VKSPRPGETEPCCCDKCIRTRAGVNITFSEYPVNTSISSQYASLGIKFLGTFITTDGANPSSPVLSGAPRFFGPVTGYFVDPETDENVGRESFSLAAGYFDDRQSTRLTLYDLEGNIIKFYVNNGLGIETFNVSIADDEKCVHKFVMGAAGSESAGFAIDNVSF
jgi:hypothetical protein